MEGEMKALSLWQTWASLVAWGEKEFETRHWYLRHRGLLAIHAAKKNDRDTQYAIGQLVRFSPRLQLEETRLPYGAVVCIVNVIDCQPTENVKLHISQREKAFGNYQPDRWAIRMQLVEVFNQPYFCPGKQGLWEFNRP